MTNLKEQKKTTHQPFFIDTLKNKFFERQSYLKSIKTTQHSNKTDANYTFLQDEDDNQSYRCSECGEMFSKEDTIATQNNSKICYNCYEDLYTTCEICGAVVPLTTINTVSFGSENIETCEDCAVQLNTVFKEKEESIVLLHHYTQESFDFIQFDFNIVLQEHLDSHTFLNIVNSITDICSIYDVPLFYLKKIDRFRVLGFTTHFLDLNTQTYKEIILKLATYIAFEPNISHIELFNMRIECSKNKQSSYIQMMNAFLTSFFHPNSISIKTLENANSVELSTDIIHSILNKAEFYRTCLHHF